MEVFHPNDTFQFEHLELTHPNSIPGGSYMTRYSYYNNKQPLYIQTTKSRSKQGIVVSGKKAYIDLLITASDIDYEFTEWIANLEKRSVDLLYEKRHLWFTQELDRIDIENSFTSPIRAYKTGNFLVRVNLEPNRNFTHIQPFSCKIFDEHKKPASVEYIKDDHTIISIIEFQGIKFTSRNFQMELILRQVLVIPDVPLFETCVISEPTSLAPSATSFAPGATSLAPSATSLAPSATSLAPSAKNSNVNAPPHAEPDAEPDAEPEPESNPKDYLGCNDHPNDEPQTLQQETGGEIKHFGCTEVEIDFDNIPDTIDTNEPNFPTTDTPSETNDSHSSLKKGASVIASIKLKKHKDVLYEMYKIAKKKAQEAKKVAIRTYLEAKEIKAAYLLDNSDLSDSDDDNDI
jgi:hypothetical protein